MDTGSSEDKDLAPLTREQRLERIRALATQEQPSPDGFSKADMVRVLERLSEVERERDEEAQQADGYVGVCLTLADKIFRSGGWTPPVGQTLLEHLQDAVTTLLKERDDRSKAIAELAETNYKIGNRLDDHKKEIKRLLANDDMWSQQADRLLTERQQREADVQALCSAVERAQRERDIPERGFADAIERFVQDNPPPDDLYVIDLKHKQELAGRTDTRR